MDTKKQIQTVYVDLMERGKHIGQIPYHFCPLLGDKFARGQKVRTGEAPIVAQSCFFN